MKGIKSLNNVFADMQNGTVEEKSYKLSPVDARIGEIISLKKIWTDVVGDKISGICSPIGIYNSQLKVVVFDTIYIAELPYLKADFIQLLATHGVVVEDIRFIPARRGYSKKELPVKFRKITEEEVAIADRASSRLQNEELRDIFNKMVRSYYALHGKGEIIKNTDS